MRIDAFAVGPLETNCFLVTCESSGKSVIVDPGGISDGLIKTVEATELVAILLTHGHFDHILGVDEIAAMTGAPVMIHANDAAMLSDSTQNGAFMIGASVTANGPDKLLDEGDVIEVGDSTLTVMHTPGHTPGCISFVGGDELVVAGDTLFRMSVGRWDLPGGSYSTLVKSVARFKDLPDGMDVYPGHGEATTIGFEKEHNPFMQEGRWKTGS